MLYGIRTGEQFRLAKAGLSGRHAHRVRRALVPVVHAAARRATGQRDVRHPLAAAVGPAAPMLGVWRLQLLREVARRGTIKAAAVAMDVTPSAVSQQLRILEAEAGVPLLERHGRRVRLTEAGEALVRHADAVTAALAAAESELAAAREGISGTLRVAAFPTAARAILPSAIASPGWPASRAAGDAARPRDAARAWRRWPSTRWTSPSSTSTTRRRGSASAASTCVPLVRDPIRLALPPGRRRGRRCLVRPPRGPARRGLDHGHRGAAPSTRPCCAPAGARASSPTSAPTARTTA